MVRRISMAAGVAYFLAIGTGCDLAAPEASPQPCGSDGGPCPVGTVCEDDPDDDCDPLNSRSCPSRCEPAPCGEMFGVTCSEGQVCVDDPSDTCDPSAGRCPGVCAEAGAQPVLCAEFDRTFVSHSLDLCKQILFICEIGWIPFYNSCGCGCEFQG